MSERPTDLNKVGQESTVLAVDVGEHCLDNLLSSVISLFCLPLSDGRRSDID